MLFATHRNMVHGAKIQSEIVETRLVNVVISGNLKQVANEQGWEIIKLNQRRRVFDGYASPPSSLSI